MDIFIDNDVFDHEAKTLAAAIDAARAKVLQVNRLIVEIRLDGRTLSEAEMDELADQEEAGEEVQLITADPAELCLDALRDVRGRLAQAREAQQQAAQKLQADQADAALQDVAAALTAWQQSQQAVAQSAQLLNITLEQLSVGERPVPQIIEELADRLTATREQLVGGDWLGLADSLAYEMDEAAEEWDALLGVMIARVEEKRQDA